MKQGLKLVAAISAHGVDPKRELREHVVDERDCVLLGVATIDTKGADSGRVVNGRVQVAPNASAGWPLQCEDFHVGLHVMARYLLGVAMGVDGPATHPIRQDAQAVAAEDPVDRGVRNADAVVARQVPDDPDRPEMVGPPQVEDLVDDSGRVVFGWDRAIGRLLTSPASPSRSTARARRRTESGDPKMPARFPDIPALFGVLQYLLLATDIALSVGHGLPASWAT